MSWSSLVDFSDYGRLVPLVANSLWAAAALGLVGGLVGVVVAARDLAFAVHGISEVGFAGAAAALLVGADVVLGSVVGSLLAAVVIGLLGVRARDRSSAIGVIMPFGLGLGVLCLALYQGRSANRFGLLTGQVVAVDDPHLTTLLATSGVVLAVLAVVWRPLLFASTDPEAAAARGVPVRALSLVFMVLLGLSVAMAVQVVGALLVLSLLITPAAAATRVSASPLWVPVLSVVFAVGAAVGGILLALGGSAPISPFVTTVSFATYLVCRLVGARRARAGRAHRPAVAAAPPAGPL